MRNFLPVLVCCVCFLSSFGQEETPREKLNKEANKLFKSENFIGALPLYLDLLSKDSEDVNYLFRTGICYLRTNIDKAKAVPYFLKLIEKKPDDPIVYLLAGSAHQYAYEFEEAITHYLFYLKEARQNEQNVELVERKIESCENARELMKFPRDVSFENLGENVNTEYPDYYPFIPLDESFTLFSSRRLSEGNNLSDKGYYSSDVYISYVRNGSFQPARMLSKNLNTPKGNEDAVGLSGNGKIALFFRDDDQAHGDIYIGKIRGDKVDSLELLPPAINSPESIEAAASLSADGKTIYFASDRAGGYGGFDIYATRLLPTGDWSLPENLGPVINTSSDEDFPNISPDGKTLYFSSKGHTTMGGYDIFSTYRESSTDDWTTAKNIGVPINSPTDNMNFRISSTGRYGYLSTLREGGYGDMDIYRVTFNEIDPSFTIIKGNVYNTGFQKIIENVSITVDHAETAEPFGNYLPNPITGRYVIILPPGKYTMHATSEDGGKFMEQLEIYDKSSFVPEIEKNIVLKK